jgi:hypothetical protein
MDEIRKPRHYTQGPIEFIDAIESMLSQSSGDPVDFCRGQAVKYLWRLPHKGKPLEDAKKAQFYIDRIVAKLTTDADHGKD